MKKSLGGGVNLPHPNWNRVKVHGHIRNYDGTKYQTLFHPDRIRYLLMLKNNISKFILIYIQKSKLIQMMIYLSKNH